MRQTRGRPLQERAQSPLDESVVTTTVASPTKAPARGYCGNPTIDIYHPLQMPRAACYTSRQDMAGDGGKSDTGERLGIFESTPSEPIF